MVKKKNNTPLIVGAVAGGCLLLCMCGGLAGLLIYMGSADKTYDNYSYDLGAVTTPTVTAATGIAAAIQLIPDGGSSSWDDGVKVLMLASYDANSNGKIDTAAEVASVPCAVWTVTDSGVRGKWTYGVRTIYGFDGGAWIGDALGYAESQRAAADAKATSCGLNNE